jgi:hypothetical protein
MSVRDAAYHTVHDYPGGSAALAPRMGKTPSTLCHEVAPRQMPGSTAKLGLLDAVALMEMTGDHRIMHAVAQRLGGMFVPLASVDDEARDASHLADLAREFAHVVEAVASSLADGRITDNELGRVTREWCARVGRCWPTSRT